MYSQDNDAGVVAIGARFSAAAAAGLGQGAGDAADAVMGPPRQMCPVRQVPFYASEFSGSGTFTQPATLGPPTGHYWSVRLISVTGFSAGSVAVTLNSVAGPVVASFAAAGQQYLARGVVLLRYGDYLVLTGTGITGTVRPQGQADLFPDWYLPEYLG